VNRLAAYFGKYAPEKDSNDAICMDLILLQLREQPVADEAHQVLRRCGRVARPGHGRVHGLEAGAVVGTLDACKNGRKNEQDVTNYLKKC
jgi:hypothetical protein